MAADSGAEDIEEAGENVIVYTASADVAKVKDRIGKMGLEIAEIKLIRKPVILVRVPDKEKLDKTISFLRKLEELDDVQKVYSNLDGNQ